MSDKYPLLTEEKKQQILSLMKYRDSLFDEYVASPKNWSNHEYGTVEQIVGDLAEECGLLCIASFMHWNPATDCFVDIGSYTDDMSALGVKSIYPLVIKGSNGEANNMGKDAAAAELG